MITDQCTLNSENAIKKNKIARSLFQFAFFILHFSLCILTITGCDPVTRHKALTTFFDGVPSLPPQEQLCKEYVEKLKADQESTDKQRQDVTSVSREKSIHPPYSEKRCSDCHDKDKQDGLIRPKKELCFVCHEDFVKGAFVHGPAAVGDCLTCHLPHTANFPSLLKLDKSQICSTCHREKRLATSLHDMVMEKKMNCPDCHDPHSGNSRYFLQ